jgi:hypothetical protein
MANVKVFAGRQTYRQTYRQLGKKLYAPDLSIRGNKNHFKKLYHSIFYRYGVYDNFLIKDVGFLDLFELMLFQVTYTI